MGVPDGLTSPPDRCISPDRFGLSPSWDVRSEVDAARKGTGSWEYSKEYGVREADVDVGSRRSREKKRLALIFEASAYIHRAARDHELRDRKSLIMRERVRAAYTRRVV